MPYQLCCLHFLFSKYKPIINLNYFQNLTFKTALSTSITPTPVVFLMSTILNFPGLFPQAHICLSLSHLLLVKLLQSWFQQMPYKKYTLMRISVVWSSSFYIICSSSSIMMYIITSIHATFSTIELNHLLLCVWIIHLNFWYSILYVSNINYLSVAAMIFSKRLAKVETINTFYGFQLHQRLWVYLQCGNFGYCTP